MVRGSYPGGNGQNRYTLVVTPLEEQINGVEKIWNTGEISTASNDGSFSIFYYIQAGE